MKSPTLSVASLDHLVLTVANIERTVRFYTSVLGMEARTFDPGRVALHFGLQKINLHEAGRVVDWNVRHATPGSADLCFLTEATMPDVISSLRACGVQIIEGPTPRTGAQGTMTSVYFYDPDENLIELAVLGQAHVSQPSIVPNHTA
jgi:catechol 2,3-dioxygenase-like lactoylglutathione lyase family enzyme